ncbi:sodium:proton antiporter [Methylobacterium organophilum]|uniref:NAD(P)H-quinone oxidoreductase subunit 4L, chloroplastic n=1 Tax=Methylobacterium organophilum TaxID=410 RepID=A0ABQ4TC34_METOR|nr:cation:proton antiporter subunit C [Methylobacterium organophilum]GJE29250.1 NAD(P)H-quinone oxidoreductase subunit 4L, chloroplastic [Methylobacterium organophilum]
MGAFLGALPYAVAGWLFAIGLYGIATSRNAIHLVGCLSVCQSATYVLLLAVGYRFDAVAPIFYDHPPGTPAVDPVVQALVLTDIVVGATVSALLLVLAIQIHKRRGTLDPEMLRPMHPQGPGAPAGRSADGKDGRA